jgi:hypothetical protein
MKHGGYRVGEKLKRKLLEIDRAAIVAYDTALLSEELSKGDKRTLTSSCTKIRKVVKEILGEQEGY